jgi:urease accessory protein
VNSINPKPLSGWQADLKLGFELRGEKTVLAERQHVGPLTVQRPFYPEGGVCHVYLIHPPGGVVGGDQLSISASAATGSHALITTPAAGKFYRSGGETASQSVSLTVASDATLEWLPQETIVYQGALFNSNMHIDLAENARFIGWEVLALGRPAAGEGFDNGEACLNWQIHRQGSLFYRERLRLDAKAFAARWGLANHSACGTLFAYPATAADLEAVQQLIGEHPLRGVTRIDDMLICRGLDARADLLRDFFQQVWQLLRTEIAHRPASAPRIWAT